MNVTRNHIAYIEYYCFIMFNLYFIETRIYGERTNKSVQ